VTTPPDSPTVSAVIPCYNGARFLRETLESVRAQSHPVLEVIVVDDGSTDDSAAIAESFGPPVRVIRQPNQGESVARNRGIDEAKGDWIAFLDADDKWEPEKLKRQCQAIAPDRVLIHTDYYLFGGMEGTRSFAHLPEDQRYHVLTLVTDPTIHISSAIVRKDAKARFPAHVRYGEDLLYYTDLLHEGRFFLVPEPLTGYRKHALQQTQTNTPWVRWHQSITQWLDGPGCRLRPEETQAIRKGWMDRLVREAWLLYWKRKWDDLRNLLQYLDTLGLPAEQTAALPRQRFPRFVYRIKDYFSSRSNRQDSSLTHPSVCQGG
jgi:glycosyltransferase involved in cell wall biosynthesis